MPNPIRRCARPIGRRAMGHSVWCSENWPAGSCIAAAVRLVERLDDGLAGAVDAVGEPRAARDASGAACRATTAPPCSRPRRWHRSAPPRPSPARAAPGRNRSSPGARRRRSATCASLMKKVLVHTRMSGPISFLDRVEDARMARQVGVPRQQRVRLGAPAQVGLRHRLAEPAFVALEAGQAAVRSLSSSAAKGKQEAVAPVALDLRAVSAAMSFLRLLLLFRRLGSGPCASPPPRPAGRGSPTSW